jgi:hypothetical protein
MGAQTFVWLLPILGLACWFIDHLARYNAMEHDKLTLAERSREYRPPANFEPFSAIFDAFGKMSELIYAPIGMALNAFAKIAEFALMPIAMGLNGIGTVMEFILKPLSMPFGMIGAIGKKF